MVIKKEFIGFVFFVLFTFVIPSLFVVPNMVIDQMTTIDKLEKKNTRLKSANHSLSHKLSATQDSLNVALSRDVMWLTRVNYSETDQALEMYYVAHVVKNRVEDCYRGHCSYKGVITDPWQFSAFNYNNQYYRNLTLETARNPLQFIKAKQTAFHAYMDTHDPTSGSKWFFSQISMRNHRFPYWAITDGQVTVNNHIDDWRFRFYNKVRM